MTSRRWECGMQFRVQFAEFLVGSEHVGRLFDGFPGDFENENVMLFGSVAFLNTVHYHVCNSSIRVHSVKRSNETFRFWKKNVKNRIFYFPDFFYLSAVLLTRFYTLDYVREWTDKCPLKNRFDSLFYQASKRIIMSWPKKTWTAHFTTSGTENNRCFFCGITRKIRS